ncbi:MAG TPA: phosphatase PAP2 family protein [Pseudomonas sp.]|uniref:PAP2 superfamily protein n=1 Tax=Ectopseudomonas oleovorans TaxID=301 RepID=A0A653B570_ECTOL|nr:phosphatase PAP2 family protein [Pseudomonas khazarica]TNF07239.1 MAG: phosphatase PAP2 family protein [Pseudomonadales bacterium]CAE6887024.1 Phosphatase PAP2 family protein [Pseudomonas oleovorans]HCA25742.1 phosphatase PAP2 family protein [Pseudomonas sp.]HIQ43032.1 phosphatase PAP2 family protein [Pseudomonas oleovorans]|tara:strand:- start:4249 stop:5043 length:795 start_codon:yes stop_codon:yes gene_type:complete
MSTVFLNTQWRVKPLLACHVVSLLLLASWLWQPTRQLWDAFDLQLFHLLNDPVHAAGLWAHIWAIGSMRPVDAGVGVVMLAVMLKAGLVFEGPQVRRALYAFLAMLIVMLLVRVLFSDLVDYMGWQRQSASLAVEGSARLTEMFPAWEERWDLKDSASRSFPGDHASVLMIWAFFLSFFARGWRLALVWAIAVIGMLPRLVAGAHWGSDAFVGGVLLSLTGLAWGCFTPLGYRASEWLEKITLPLTSRLARLPLLGRISVVSGH